MDELCKMQKVDEWFVLEEATTGKLHLKLEWLSLLSTPDKLGEVPSSLRMDQPKGAPVLSSAVLLVFLDSAKNLPLGKKLTSEPSTYVQFTVGQKKYDSKIRYKTVEPVWEESFIFLIQDPRVQQLKVEAKDDKHKCSLGTITLPLSELLEAENMMLDKRFPLQNSGPNSTVKLKIGLRVLSLEKGSASDQPSSMQAKKMSMSDLASSTASLPTDPFAAHSTNQNAGPSTSISTSSVSQPYVPSTTKGSASSALGPTSTHSLRPSYEMPSSAPGSVHLMDPKNRSNLAQLSHVGRSTSSLAISGSHRESTPSIASDISMSSGTQELQQRLQQMQNGSALGQSPLGHVQLTVRYSAHRNKLIVVVHCCRNLIPFNKDGSDPYVRLYLLPNKKRSGRKKTSIIKKNQNPVFDQTFEFSVASVELHRRVLDVAVKNGGGILPKHKGLLGKVLVDFSPEDLADGWTAWHELSVDGLPRPEQT
ncbi:extended synaptotagmin-2-like [Arapaima gigas]